MHSINFNNYIITSFAQDGQAEYRRVRLLPVRVRAGGAALGAAAAAARDGRGAGAGRSRPHSVPLFLTLGRYHANIFTRDVRNFAQFSDNIMLK